MASVPKRNWEGIFTSTTRSEQKSYYGPSSSSYFMGRIGTYLSKTLRQSFHDHYMQQPRGVSRTLKNPGEEVPVGKSRDVPKPAMSRAQEEYFLSLFWESHHACCPILDEGKFRALYDSLWHQVEGGSSCRRPNALVDIVVALSMQYGWSFLFRNDKKQYQQHDDASIAGRWYYRRGQSLLAADLESPTLTTLQCHIFSTVYLCCASFQNMAHTTLAIATRTAQILGLHVDPPPAGTSPEELQLRRRLWWVLNTIEAKTCMKLHRPLSVSRAVVVSVPLPDDGRDAASMCRSSLGAYDEQTTWLTYSVQVHKLITVVTDIHLAFHDKCAQIIREKDIASPYQDPLALESCAEFLASQLHAVQTWADQVPEGIRLQRRSNGRALSLDPVPLHLDTAAVPTWLQRHRVCLELMYHTMLSNLHRPFITFSPNTGSITPAAARHASTCASHAVAHTRIMHQVLRETDLLSGWQEFFLWQWNATVNAVGFVLASPVHAATSRTRAALDDAVEIFEVFGCNFGVAASAAAVTKDLTAKADLLADRLKSGIMATSGCADANEHGSLGEADDDYDGVGIGEDVVGCPRGSSIQEETSFMDFMDWALTADSFNSFEDLFADASSSNDFWGIS